MKKILFFSALILVSFLSLKPVQAETDFSQEFGSCYADPVYTDNFSGQAKSAVNVRNVACMSGSQVISTLKSGEKVQVLYRTDGWYKVKTSSGVEGWVGSGFIKKVSDDSSAVVSTSTTSSESEDVTDTTLSNRLKGYIVLAVEKNGEAYYLNDEGYAFYMKDGDAAYEVMRKLSLGVSNANLDKILDGSGSVLINRLKGKIVLAVEKNGEAYYISPKNLKIYYLKDGSAAFDILRKEGLGISNQNLSKLTKKNINEYKKEKQQASSTDSDANSDDSSNNGSITLNTEISGNKVYLNWQALGFTPELGYKVVMSKTINPVYPGNDYHYFSDSSTLNDEWEIDQAGTYYFRVCEYLGGKCGVYSNNEKVIIYVDQANSGGSIFLDGSVSGDDVNLNWSLSDMTSSLGFKVVISQSENPVYPGNEYHYYSDKDIRNDQWSNLDSGTYYFRVCEYLGDKCGVYSNNFQAVIN